jgi:hypothetical protein
MWTGGEGCWSLRIRAILAAWEREEERGCCSFWRYWKDWAQRGVVWGVLGVPIEMLHVWICKYIFIYVCNACTVCIGCISHVSMYVSVDLSMYLCVYFQSICRVLEHLTSKRQLPSRPVLPSKPVVFSSTSGKRITSTTTHFPPSTARVWLRRTTRHHIILYPICVCICICIYIDN